MTGIPINLWNEMKNGNSVFKEDYYEKVNRIREGVKLDLPDGREATHIMTWGDIGEEGTSKYVAFPTLFPGYDNPELKETEEWGFLGTPEGEFPEEAYQEALKRDEVFYFDTKEEAEEWASPNAPWKEKKNNDE